MRKRKGILGIAGILVLIAVIGSIGVAILNVPTGKQMNTFKSCDEMINTFSKSIESQQKSWVARGFGEVQMLEAATDMAAAPTAAPEAGGAEYSETNVQVEGVDEADIVKTDGTYIYTITQDQRYYYYDKGGKDAGSKLVIVKAYPGDDAEVLSETDLGDFYPSEIFIDGNRLLIFGITYEEIGGIEPAPQADVAQAKMIAPYPYPRRLSLLTVQLWDISDREDPDLVRAVDFEGSYLTSRKIGTDVYFVVNSYPNYAVLETVGTPDDKGSELIPLYKDSAATEEYVPSCGCTDVGYFQNVRPERFITLASISMSDDDADVEREVIIGSGENVYASLENLYIAENHWPFWGWVRPLAEGESTVEDSTEKTVIHKFSLENGKVSYQSEGEVPGHILNQFSMDEHKGYFRIATTAGRLTRSGGTTSNNIYVLDEDMEKVGEIEDIAPGESIYSARFMGDRAYLVTFKKIDPFFVIDMTVPTEPKILGKLKIPGYSDYLHPYDENHIIGIGKETVEAEEDWGDFSWYQGVKMAVFDVTDVSDPVVMHKVIIGDRGTDSEVLRDHKAFLFDREKNLLVIPVLLAEIKDKENARPNSYGDFVYQGAYVYDLTLEDGFQLKGRVTHVDDEETFLKSGYYYAGGEYAVRRSLYIGDNLYTLSAKKIKVNSLQDMSEVKELVFG